jgi:multicomponent Na+:H+ antiporter subunit D
MIIRNLPAIIPLLFLAAALLIPLINLLKKNSAFSIAVFVSLLASVVSGYGLYYVDTNETIRYSFGGWQPPIGIEYVYDRLAAFVALVINVISLIVITHSLKAVKEELSDREMPYYAITMLLLCGLNGIVLTGDIFNLYVFVEISSLAGYALIAVGEERSPFAAFRYLLIGTIGASLYLLGVGFLFIMTGTLNMINLAQILPSINETPTVIVAVTLMVSGIGIKTAIFPMHGWLPDSYTYAPSTTSALIAPIGTKVGAYVLFRLLFFIFGIDYFSRILPVGDLIAFFASAGIIFGSIMAIAQKELKRMLAYSSVAQIGYIALGIGLANPLGFIGAVLHVLNHAFMKACLFLIAANLRINEGHSDISKFDIKLGKKYPWTFAAFTIAALSMIGLPPMAGFFSKWYLVLATIDSKAWFYLGVILLSSLLNAVYFFRILERIYMKKYSSDEIKEEVVFAGNPNKYEGGLSLLIPVVLLAAGIIVLGLFNASIVSLINRMIS